MERVTLDQLSTKANISTDLSKEGFLSRQQRLQSWTELLAREPDRPLNTFLQTAYMAAEARDSLRCPASALTVAFQVPVSSEERRVGEGCVRSVYSRGSPYPS